MQGNCSTPPNYCRAEGIIKNCNTIEDYKNLDRAAILDRCAQTVRPAPNVFLVS